MATHPPPQTIQTKKNNSNRKIEISVSMSHFVDMNEDVVKFKDTKICNILLKRWTNDVQISISFKISKIWLSIWKDKFKMEKFL